MTPTQRDLLRNVFELQEQERRRIARDLHDHLGQQITALRMVLASINALSRAVPPIAEHALRADAIAREIDESIDALAWDLRPESLDQLGTFAAIEQLVERWSARVGIEARYRAIHTETLRINSGAGLNLYRILQEALHNVEKHAGATHVEVAVEKTADALHLVVRDDGKGFNPSMVNGSRRNGSLGLVHMRERAALLGGSMDVESAPARGTMISFRLPLSHILEPLPAPSP